ncbi:hypothetical protein SAMN05216266_111197 [Amycolatopsis marina]|uniref:DUF1989 domain-containing protein n=1 Tax=Amycolatopsis marina TaxID=490629 RepID=A0A1I1B1Y9_9PSEU|nr:urea carboxylase-associated family protein [Amycolatopsis marina]SFB44364.1 hypothetical protein SAMN05216266_111197 [Amycolatopsis marina]
MQLNSLIERVEIPARQARSVRVGAGRRVRVTTETGGQVGDLFAFTGDDLAEHLSAAHTRAHVGRLFPAVGEQFVTDLREPILTLIEDASPGRHDMLIPACDPARYRALGVVGAHASCAENLRRVAGPLGREIDVVPQPVNVFMDIPVDQEGDLAWLRSPAAAGASITFEAVRECVVIVSACPQDLVDINGGTPKPLVLEYAAHMEGSVRS